MKQISDHRKINIAAFTGGTDVPSARFRVRQYIPSLRQQGIDTTEFISSFGSYPPKDFAIMRPIWGLATLTQRIPHLAATQRHHVTLFQRELVSTFMTLERFSKRPRILDVDDAIWLNRSGLGPKIARACDGIICGNSFLAEYFSKWNPQIFILPTAIDTDRFSPTKKMTNDNKSDKKIVIVWSGTSSGFPFLYSIEETLNKVLMDCDNVYLRIISDSKPHFAGIRPSSIEFLKWNPSIEASGIQTADIGIMPLWDNPWTRGKCSFKMLTYMACGLPVIASPVGMNREVLGKAELGLGPNNLEQWADALSFLIVSEDIRKRMGANGRQVVNKEYSISAVAPRLAGIIRSFC